MKKLISLFLCFCTILTLLGCDQKDEPNPINPVDVVYNRTENINNFAIELFKMLDNNENTAFSPASLAYALGLLAEGADGVTKIEFEKTFGMSMDNLISYLTESMISLKSTSESTKISIANSLWLRKNIQTNKDYLEKVKSDFNSEVYSVDLTDKSIVNKVNNWIKKKTNKLIDKMITKPFTDNTYAVILNALYFKAIWYNQFSSDNTFKDNFILKNGSIIEKEFMHNQDKMSYLENDYCEGCLLPYDDDRTIMILLKSKNNIDDLLQNINANDFKNLVDDSQIKKINLSLPKFTIESTMELTGNVEKIGLSSLFSCPNLSKMSSEEISVSSILQKVKVIVDEKGTEAAAATMIALTDTCAPVEEEIINLAFDNPFIYIIYDTMTNTILFMGVVQNPTN